ncbi:MAG: GGDEF domain-containing protein [Treponema sp.]|jgi:diguanylate cyclase (GGDEF)-like protein|nr:GGDEF domain-containing protein [Treponema sp.]
MLKNLYSWRYYSFGKERYHECLSKILINNLQNLRQANTIAAIFAGCFSLLSLIVEKDLLKAGICLGVTVIALLFSAFINYKMQTVFVNNRFIYIYTTLFYVYVMGFGIYLSVWSSPDKLAAIFLCLLICILLMFINSPLFNLYLTLGAIICFIVSTIIAKSTEIWVLDIINALVAGVIGLYFNWQVSKLRLGLEISATMLEDERNSYFDQSTIDELTKLRNRRDFQQTFKRYLANYRTSDTWLCIAILDIDFFKYYNDHYGHPKGDDCLRAVGGVLNSLQDSLDVYSARVGGEEFALLWFESNASHVDDVVSHLQGLIKDLKIPHEKSKVSPYVSISIGVFVERCGTSDDTQALYEKADKALYNAKEGGRNCAVIFGGEIEQYKITSVS